MTVAQTLESLSGHITACRQCPRLVRYREEVGQRKVRRFRDWTYWARPVPGFGDPRARLLIVGLAPAAHGGNRTGRVFTGDRSGDWLYRALWRSGFANRPESVAREDGLALRDCFITAAVKCAPPANRPTPDEFATCRPYLVRELETLVSVQLIVALGAVAWASCLRAWVDLGGEIPRPRPQFRHGARVDLGSRTLLGSYHPSQRNTQTGFLSRRRFEAIFQKARTLLRAA